MMDLHFFEYKRNEEFQSVVLATRLGDQYIFSRSENEKGWHLPMGVLEEGESLERAIDRILKEEVGGNGFSYLPLCSFFFKGRKGALFLAELKGTRKCERDTLLFHTLPLRLSETELAAALFEKAEAMVSFQNSYGKEHLKRVRQPDFERILALG